MQVWSNLMLFNLKDYLYTYSHIFYNRKTGMRSV